MRFDDTSSRQIVRQGGPNRLPSDAVVKLTDDLYRFADNDDSPRFARANRLRFNNQSGKFEEPEEPNEMQVYAGAFWRGYSFAGEQVHAVLISGRWYAQGCGHSILYGKLKGTLEFEGTQTVELDDVTDDEGNPVEVEAEDYFLMEDQEMQEDAKVAVQWSDLTETWRVLSGQCGEPEEEEEEEEGEEEVEEEE
jgi:hypothetical protein